MVTLPARNNRAYDIIAKRGDDSAAIRVKTKSPLSDAFQWQAKKTGNIFLELSEREDFCILVDIPEQSGDTYPTYYVVPTHVIETGSKRISKSGWKLPEPKGSRERRQT
jgi:hypothetical protein